MTFTYRAGAEAAAAVVASTSALEGSVRALAYTLGRDDPQVLVDTAVSTMGGLDSMILNAASWRGGKLTDVPEDMWWGLVETNLRGSVQVVRAGIAALLQSTAGSITFVGSAVGTIGFPGDSAYASSKSALVGLARSLAKELGRDGIRVNVVAPGFVETDMSAEVTGATRDRILGRSVLRRFGTPREIADATVFLSEEAGFATGVVLPVDGGWTL